MARLVQRNALNLTEGGAATPSSVNAQRPIRRTSATPATPAVERATPIRRAATTPKPTAAPPIPIPDPSTTPAAPKAPRSPKVASVKPIGFKGGINAFDARVGRSTSFLGPLAAEARGWGKANPFAPLQTPGKPLLKSFLPPKGISKGARLGRATTMALILAPLLQGTGDINVKDIEDWYKSNGYPDDVAKVAAEAFLKGSTAGTGAVSLADYAAKDVQIAGAFAVGGAAIGSVIPGPGTLAGAGIGWATGSTIAGVSNMLQMGEQFLNVAFGNDPLSTNWIDIPTLHDIAPGISGIVGQDNYYGSAQQMAGDTAADLAINEKFPNRFNNSAYVYQELERLDTNYYGRTNAQDPRAQEMYDLISQGYFVKQTANGLGIDNQAYYDYLSKTMMYRDMNDKKKFLPTINSAGTALASQGKLTEDQWYKLFGNAE